MARQHVRRLTGGTRAHAQSVRTWRSADPRAQPDLSHPAETPAGCAGRL